MRGKKRKVTVYGKKYPSMKAVADKFSINYVTFVSCVNAHPYAKYEDIVEHCLKFKNDGKVTNGNPVTVNGVTYPSVRAAAISYSLNYVRVNQRMQKGETAEEAITGMLKWRAEHPDYMEDIKSAMYTKQELKKLEKLYFAGVSKKDIATILGRSVWSVKDKINVLGLPKKKKTV